LISPELATGDVVVMDNLPGDKVGGIREVIEQAGATLLCPQYSRHLAFFTSHAA